MAKSEQKLKARELRRNGESVKDISLLIGVSKSTASMWVRDIILNVEQLERLKQKMIRGSELGRTKGALIQKQRRIDLEKKLEKQSIQEINTLTDNELLLSGLCLYWGEGSKKQRELSWCNSDPQLINFMILWLKRCYGIDKDRLGVNVAINQMHKNRNGLVRRYWSRTIDIPIGQFRNTIFKKTKLRKSYENFDEHYGTLRVRVLKPGALWYKIVSQIKALSLIGQRSSVVSSGRFISDRSLVRIQSLAPKYEY